MNHKEYLLLMDFPLEWVDWDMVPEGLAKLQVEGYERGHENASEHDRNGAFHWWLKRSPSKEQLKMLLKLSYLDPDQIMASDVRNYIRKSTNYDKSLESEPA